MTRAEYENYLKSPEWERLRAKVSERANGQCEREVNNARCLRPHQQTHHLTYERIGCEQLSDLMAVCVTCHKAIHGKGRDLLKEYGPTYLDIGSLGEIIYPPLWSVIKELRGL